MMVVVMQVIPVFMNIAQGVGLSLDQILMVKLQEISRAQ